MSSAARSGEVDLNDRSSVADLTAFRRDILRILDKENHQKGLSIKGELEAYYGTQVNHGRLYPNLDTLVDRSLIQKSERDKRTNDYALTERGRRALQRRDAWVERGYARMKVTA